MALTLKERRFGRHVAAQRQADNVRRRRPNAHGATAGLSLHEQGALAELAFLRMLGLPLDRWASGTRRTMPACSNARNAPVTRCALATIPSRRNRTRMLAADRHGIRVWRSTSSTSS